jgi:hypothetical protein
MSAQTLFRRQSGDFLLDPEFLPGIGAPALSATNAFFNNLNVSTLNTRPVGTYNAFSGKGVFAAGGVASSFTLPASFFNSDWAIIVTREGPYTAPGSTVAWAKVSGPNSFDAASGAAVDDNTLYEFTYIAVGLPSA